MRRELLRRVHEARGHVARHDHVDAPQPSRAEFFYARTGPAGPGLPLPERRIDYQELSAYGEHLLTPDLSIFADLGLDEMDLGMIAGNLDLFPDEALAIIARKLGFGQAYERALTLALGRVP